MRILIRITALALSLALILSGCGSGMSIFSNYRQVENLDLARTVCVDKTAEGVNVLICASTTGEKPRIRMFEQTAGRAAEALAGLQTTVTGSRIDLSHTENLVVGEDAAKEGIGELLDYVIRYGEVRLDTNLFIVKGSGRELMRGIAGSEASPASVLMSLKDKLPHQGQGTVFTCRETAVSLADRGCALVMVIEAVEQEKLFDGEGERRVLPVGLGLLADGKLTDTLTERETLGALLLRSRLKSMEAALTVEGKALSASVNSVKTELTPAFSEDGQLAGFRAHFTVDANVVNTGSGLRLEDSAVRKEAERQLSALLEDAATAALEKCRDSGRDFLELRSTAWRAEPLRFQKERFPERLPRLTFAVKADVTLKHTYDVVDSPSDDGEEEPGLWERLTRYLSGS